jgi:hypothetical protein
MTEIVNLIATVTAKPGGARKARRSASSFGWGDCKLCDWGVDTRP